MLGKYASKSNLIGKNRVYDAQNYGFQTPKKSNQVNFIIVYHLLTLNKKSDTGEAT
jgi:hypothetical protein